MDLEGGVPYMPFRRVVTPPIAKVLKGLVALA